MEMMRDGVELPFWAANIKTYTQALEKTICEETEYINEVKKEYIRDYIPVDLELQKFLTHYLIYGSPKDRKFYEMSREFYKLYNTKHKEKMK